MSGSFYCLFIVMNILCDQNADPRLFGTIRCAGTSLKLHKRDTPLLLSYPLAYPLPACVCIPIYPLVSSLLYGHRRGSEDIPTNEFIKFMLRPIDKHPVV